MRRLALAIVLGGVVAGPACKELDGRSTNRQGTRLYREMQFIDSAATFEHALTTVDHPIIHYNAALAYSKVAGAKSSDEIIRLGVQGDDVCTRIPGTKPESARVCVKDGERKYPDCDEKNVCPSSASCEQVTLCTLPTGAVAELATKHFQVWLDANPKDDETRKQMTQVWLNAELFDQAIKYWEGLLAQRPDDPEVMGNLAGINLKSGKWRTSIEWYTKVAETAKEPSSKVAAYQFIGNVAWSKLNSRTLGPVESVELADLGIGALQAAAEIEPKNPKLFGLQASLFNFRSLNQGASWAAAIDRASAEDLKRIARVISQEAKKLQQQMESAQPSAEKPEDGSTGG
jgi:tetratricopeptide (TPR) repeat protein